MKVVCFIDSLVSGGAQRQICMLALLLKQRGHEVEMMVYRQHDFFRPILDRAGIQVLEVLEANKLKRAWALRKAIHGAEPDIVIAYQTTAAVYAELAVIGRRNFSLIVSERNRREEERRVVNWIQYQLHRLADAVIANSCEQERLLTKAAPWLRARTTVIYNGVDLDHFQPCSTDTGSGTVKLLVLARFSKQKNSTALVEALALLRDRHGIENVIVDWYGNNFFVDGRPTALSEVYVQTIQLIKEYRLEDRFRLHDPTPDVLPLYQECTAFCLPSLYEGLPNVVCEAMACGKPVLASRIGDNERLVADGENGILFDPKDPEKIAEAIQQFLETTPESRHEMGTGGRKRAEKMLSTETFVAQYEKVFEQVSADHQTG